MSTPHEFEPEVPYLAFYKGPGGLFTHLIRWRTWSKYSHVELVLKPFAYSSSERDRGVRAIPAWKVDREKWDVIKLDGLDKDRVELIQEWLDGHREGAYNWHDIWAFIIKGSTSKATTNFICSEYCCTAVQQAGILSHLDPAKTSPGELYTAAKAWTEGRAELLEFILRARNKNGGNRGSETSTGSGSAGETG